MSMGTQLVPSVGEPVPEPVLPSIPDGIEADDSDIEISTGSFFQCTEPGFFEFEADCIHFRRCVFLDNGELTDLLYRCPERYVYNPDQQRCTRRSEAPTCAKDATTLLTLREPFRPDQVHRLREEDLQWFFSHEISRGSVQQDNLRENLQQDNLRVSVRKAPFQHQPPRHQYYQQAYQQGGYQHGGYQSFQPETELNGLRRSRTLSAP